jgi:hypothetical protein
MFLSKGDLGCQSTFDIFFSLSKDELELGCCTLEEYLSDAYDEHILSYWVEEEVKNIKSKQVS